MQEWVLFVPGFCASDLYRRDEGGDRESKIWLSQVDVAWNGVGILDTDPEISPATLDVVRPGSPLYSVYQPFYAWAAQKGLPVLAFGYDWRAGIDVNGDRLNLLIESHIGTQARFTIIAHSMGGLVAARAIHGLSPEAIPLVRRLITCGTPWRGAFKALQLFSGQHETVETIVALNVAFSRRSKYQWRQETIRTVASWGGAYDLLPMPELITDYPPGEGQDFRTGELLAKVNPWFKQDQYAAAVARRVLNRGLWPEQTHFNFRGTGRETVGPWPVMYDGYPDYWQRGTLGDGVVPEASSRAPQAYDSLNRDFDVDHEQFLSDYLVQLSFSRIMGVA